MQAAGQKFAREHSFGNAARFLYEALKLGGRRASEWAAANRRNAGAERHLRAELSRFTCPNCAGENVRSMMNSYLEAPGAGKEKRRRGCRTPRGEQPRRSAACSSCANGSHRRSATGPGRPSALTPPASETLAPTIATTPLTSSTPSAGQALARHDTPYLDKGQQGVFTS
jgi:hypothetical protein